MVILVKTTFKSGLGQDLYEDGYKNVVNVDYSQIVIETMKKRYPDIEWLEMDIRNMKFDDSSFDLVIDKGTIDALMCEKGDLWIPSDQVVEDVTSTVNEVNRILKPNGVFFYLTFGQPHFRKRFLERSSWTLETISLGMYFMYIMRNQTFLNK